MSSILERIMQIADNENITLTALEAKIGASKGVLTRAFAKKTDIQAKWVIKIVENYHLYNADWLLTGNGEMKNQLEIKKRIPLYNDVDTIGGTNIVAESSAVYASNEYIDAGDWFPGATAAIHHYNNSMIEYPSGCVLAIREVKDTCELNWGEHYVIEYEDYRVTKEIQPLDDEYIMAYSTNMEKYADGRLRFPPFKIKKAQIRHMFFVLGYVVKRYSNGVTYTKTTTI